MAIISGFEAQNAFRRSIMVDSTPVDHPNAAWDSGYRGPKFASSPVVPEDLTAPNFAHPDQILPKFGALRAPNFVSGFWASGNPGFSASISASKHVALARWSISGEKAAPASKVEVRRTKDDARRNNPALWLQRIPPVRAVQAVHKPPANTPTAGVWLSHARYPRAERQRWRCAP